VYFKTITINIGLFLFEFGKGGSFNGVCEKSFLDSSWISDYFRIFTRYVVTAFSYYIRTKWNFVIYQWSSFNWFIYWCTYSLSFYGKTITTIWVQTNDFGGWLHGHSFTCLLSYMECPLVLVHFKDDGRYRGSYAAFWFTNLDYHNGKQRNTWKKYCYLLNCFLFGIFIWSFTYSSIMYLLSIYFYLYLIMYYYKYHSKFLLKSYYTI